MEANIWKFYLTVILWQIAWKCYNFKSNKKLLNTAWNWGIGYMVSICKRIHNCCQIKGTRILRFRLKLLILEDCIRTNSCFYIYRLPSKKRLIWGPTKSNPIYLSSFWQAIPLMSLSTSNILWADKLRKIPSLYSALLAVNKGNTSKLSSWGFNYWEPDKKDVTLLQIMVITSEPAF